MNILQINKFYHIVGGSSRYFFDISKLLEDKGHSLGYFSMKDEKNLLTKWSKYFVRNTSFEKLELNRLPRILTRMFYSIEARRNISELLDHFKPDIAHLHSIYHHLSPSIILELKKKNIPIVQTLHDYHLISPSHTLFHNGRICEITKKTSLWKAIFHKCVKNSYSASFLEVLEQYFHHFMGIYTKNVDIFITPSLFMNNKLVEYGISKDKIQVLNNFCDYRKFTPTYNPGSYILYFGRLSPEKGLIFLLEVMEKLPQIRLNIVGKGLQKAELKEKAKSRGLNNVMFIEHQSGESLRELIYNSRFTITPSECYETFSLASLESFASGKPVVASRIGALPEIVKDKETGFLFEAGNAEDCVNKINKLWNNPILCRKMGRNARGYVEKYFSPEDHYEKMIGIYKKAINLHK